MQAKILLFISICLFSFSSNLVYSYNQIYVTPQTWSEVDVSQGLSKQFVFQFDLQYARMGDFSHTNLLEYNNQLTIRPWLHYYANPDTRISLFSGVWDNYPIPEVGNRAFVEYRNALQLSLYSRESSYYIANRFRIEQRNIQDKQNEYESVFRFRYQLKYLQNLDQGKNWYFVAFNEIFANGGSKITGSHLFDQNRVFMGFGYNFNDNYTFEGGYFNQTQLESNGRNLDVNHVLQLTMYVNDIF